MGIEAMPTMPPHRARALQAVNTQFLDTYRQIAHDIVEFEQGGKVRADYGKALLQSLSRDLTLLHGKGFSRSNLIRIRQFYLAYPKGATLSHFLTWSHVVELWSMEKTSNETVKLSQQDPFQTLTRGMAVKGIDSALCSPKTGDSAPLRWGQDSIVVSTFPKP